MFKNISLQSPQGKTVKLTLHQLRMPAGSPVLLVEHLGETNTSYWLDALARSKADIAASQANAKRRELTPAELAAKLADARASKREVVALHAIRGFENLFHDDGKPATLADVHDFVNALPDDVFDYVWTFAENPNNFREASAVIESDAKAVAGK